MKVETVKEIKLSYSVEERNELDKVVNLIKTLINEMNKEKCDTIYGEDYDDTINISINDLQEIVATIENIKYTTEMF